MNTIISLVTNGKLNKVASAEISSILNSFEGKRVEVIIKKARSKRSDNQNRYMWGVVIPYLQEGFKGVGYDLSKDEVHQFVKSKFNTIEIVNDSTGEIVLIPMSTTKLSKSEFADYLEKIFQFSAEFLGVVIPNPNEQITMNF